MKIHLESFMWERIFEKKFFKKSHIQTPNGVLLIFKLPFPNGSYCNGVCRALWALYILYDTTFTILYTGAEETAWLIFFFTWFLWPFGSNSCWQIPGLSRFYGADEHISFPSKLWRVIALVASQECVTSALRSDRFEMLFPLKIWYSKIP